MAGSSRSLAKALLFVGVLLVLLPFLHFKNSADRSPSLAEAPSAPAKLVKASVEKPAQPSEDAALPQQPGFQFVVAD